MIPAEKQPLVDRALQEAFGTTQIEDLQKPAGGLSTALVFRIVVRGTPYMLRIITRADAHWDPTRHFASMQAASDSGVAPRIHYASIEDLILITDFVSAQPYPADIAARVARTVRVVHALPPFALPHAFNYFNAMEGFVRRFQSAKLLPESATDEFFRCFDEIARVYPRNDVANRVSCHNDLKPQNILFDGARIQLVDWEAAFLNDRYVDLAYPANFFVADEPAEVAYLAEYFGEPPTEYQRARFFLVCQLISAFCAGLLIPMVAASGTAIEPSMTAPTFRDFHDRLLSGDITLRTSDDRQQYAKVHMNHFVQNTNSQRCKEALRLVAAAHQNE